MTARGIAVAVILILSLAYPVALLARGLPSFSPTARCEHPATSDGAIDLTLGRFTGMQAADAVRNRARAVGFVSAEAALDACGRIVVVVPGYTTLAGARSAVGEARAAGLDARPEFAP
jgi:hypothetical protein